jgi:sugar/nucleoside kinase (ribokinase family)
MGTGCSLGVGSVVGGDVVVVGSANADLVVPVPRQPVAGETLMSTGDMHALPGGKGANQSAAAAKLLPQQGARARLVALVGQDGNGLMLKNALAASAVDLTLVREVGGGVPTGAALVMVLPSGDNSIVVVGGANQCDAGWEEALGKRISSSMVAAAASEGQQQPPPPPPPPLPRNATAASLLISGGGSNDVAVVLLQREVPEWVNARAADLAALSAVPPASAAAARVVAGGGGGGGGGTHVVLDAGGCEGPLPEALLRGVTVLSPNETELARLVGGVVGVEAEATEEGGDGDGEQGGDGRKKGRTKATVVASRAWVDASARTLLAQLVAARPPGDPRARAVLVKLGAAGSALFSWSPPRVSLLPEDGNGGGGGGSGDQAAPGHAAAAAPAHASAAPAPTVSHVAVAHGAAAARHPPVTALVAAAGPSSSSAAAAAAPAPAPAPAPSPAAAAAIDPASFEAIWQPAFDPREEEGKQVVDTTGAGDCFTAAFAVSRFSEGRCAREALEFATAAACLCVQRRGAMPSLPTREDVEALLARRLERWEAQEEAAGRTGEGAGGAPRAGGRWWLH